MKTLNCIKTVKTKKGTFVKGQAYDVFFYSDSYLNKLCKIFLDEKTSVNTNERNLEKYFNTSKKLITQ